MQTFAARLSLPAAALVAAGVVTATPVVAPLPSLPPVAASAVHRVQVPQIQLSASVIDILQLPALRQWILNEVDDVVTLFVGLGKSGEGIIRSIGALPEVLRTLTQQVFSGDWLGALTTVEVALIGAVTVIGAPLLDAIIERRQRALVVTEAMQEAFPAALIGLGTSLVAGFDVFARGVIVAIQNLVDSLLPVDFGNVLDALVDGTRLIVQSLGEGAERIVDGIVFAQQTVAEALATKPTVETERVSTNASAGASGPEVGFLPDPAVVLTLQIDDADAAVVTEDTSTIDSAAPSGDEDQPEVAAADPESSEGLEPVDANEDLEDEPDRDTLQDESSADETEDVDEPSTADEQPSDDPAQDKSATADNTADDGGSEVTAAA